MVIPFTIATAFTTLRPEFRTAAIVDSVGADLVIALVLVGLRRNWFRAYHLPFFLVAGVVCTVAGAVLLQITGGGQESNYLFPYFLVLFGVATLFPGRLSWVLAVVTMSPVAYLVSELWVQGGLAPGRPVANLVLLADYAFIAAVANRITTRLFFREAEHRLALEKVNVQLRELDQAKSDFFANLSHDLRSPLTVILGPLKSLADGEQHLDGEQRSYVDLALRGASRLDAMIQDLLELARIDAGVGRLSTSRIDLNDMVEEICAGVSVYAEQLGLEVVCEAPDHPLNVTVDEDKVERVITNLLSNAFKFSPAGKQVLVRLRDEAEGIFLSVTDQGIGIAEEDLSEVFARFKQGRAEAKARRKRGAGLGLAVVKEFVELHGGTVRVESKPGVGSTFEIRFPRTIVSAEPNGPSRQSTASRSRNDSHLLLPQHPLQPPAPPPLSGVGPRVLLVEDDDELRSFLNAELSSTYQLLIAGTAEDGLRLAATHTPELVIADVMLPGIDGMELCRRLRTQPNTVKVPILIFSARGDLQTRLDAFSAGADDFVHKPFEPQEFRARLDSLLRRSAPTDSSASSSRTSSAPVAATGTARWIG